MTPARCSGCERVFGGEDGWGVIHLGLAGGVGDGDYAVRWVCSPRCMLRTLRELIALVAYVVVVSGAEGGRSGGDWDVARDEESLG